MANYEDYKLLFNFLKLKKNPKNHWNDIIGWEIVEQVHNKVLVANKFHIQVIGFLALICDLIEFLFMVIVFKIHVKSYFSFS
jgi:hypothetical protein